jgi:hypothetical protein
LNIIKPKLFLSVQGNRVEVDWGWGGFSTRSDLCELQVNRGDGKGFVLLTFDSTPGYIDLTPCLSRW